MKPALDVYSDFLNYVPDATLVVNRDGQVVASNEQAASLFACTDSLNCHTIADHLMYSVKRNGRDGCAFAVSGA